MAGELRFPKFLRRNLSVQTGHKKAYDGKCPEQYVWNRIASSPHLDHTNQSRNTGQDHGSNVCDGKVCGEIIVSKQRSDDDRSEAGTAPIAEHHQGHAKSKQPDGAYGQGTEYGAQRQDQQDAQIPQGSRTSDAVVNDAPEYTSDSVEHADSSDDQGAEGQALS